MAALAASAPPDAVGEMVSALDDLGLTIEVMTMTDARRSSNRRSAAKVGRPFRLL